MWNKVTTRVNCRGRTQSHIGMMVTTKGELRMKGAYPILGSLSFHRRPFPLKLCCRPDVKPRACATIARKNRTRPPIWLAPAPKVLCEGERANQDMPTRIKTVFANVWDFSSHDLFWRMLIPELTCDEWSNTL